MFKTTIFGKSLTITKFLGLRGIYGKARIGEREVVGHGCNGIPAYKDDAHFPFPAIRFKEDNPELIALREKEKGDWKNLSIREKKSLYRAAFCQTFAEFQHPTGQWKLVLGGVLFFTSFAFWMQMFTWHYVNEPLPATLSEEGLKAQLRTILDLHVNPIDGISSYWDYEKDKWKALREKEKGYWTHLTLLEKKALYRASFCQTFEEFQANTGQWKLVLGCVFISTSFAFWVMIFNHFYVYEPLPISLSKQAQKDQLRRMIDIRVNPIDGLTSYWNYEVDRWNWIEEN